MKPKINLEHRQFFDQCMKDAGYADYKSLAVGLDPLEVDTPRLTHMIYQLASGLMSPIYKDIDRNGQSREVASEIATLLNMNFDDLFAHTLPSPDVVNADALVTGQDAMTSPDLLLTQRDILAVASKLKPEDLDTYISIEIEGMTQAELVTKRGMPHVPQSYYYIGKEFKRAEAVLDRMGGDIRLQNVGRLDDIISSAYYNPSAIANFNASSAVAHLALESKRVLNITECDGLTEDSKVKIKRDFDRALRGTEEKLAYPISNRYALHQCDGYEMMQMFEIYADHGRHPSRAFMNACVSNVNVIKADPLRGGYMARLNAALEVLYRLSPDSYSEQAELQSSYSRFFAIT